MAVNASVEELHNSWRTELNAPEILPYKEDLVESMHNLLKRQEVIAILQGTRFSQRRVLFQPKHMLFYG